MGNDDNTIVLTNMDGTTTTFQLSDIIDTSGDITIDLNNTYGATTTYQVDTTFDPGMITINSGSINSSYTISTGIDTISLDNIWKMAEDHKIDPEEVSKMCKEYPGLEKVWNNFKAVYDMVKQDYEGKKQAGELDE
jgi:hypothetical protein